jgi:polyisoprenoid-binding protein YceI
MTASVVEIPGYVAGTWDIDVAHSLVGFSVRHFGISKVQGRFNAFEAEIVTGADPLVGSSVTAKIELASIDTGNAQRDEHVRSADFFEVDQNPYLTYQSTGIKQDGDDYLLDGELTLKGITRQVPLKLEVLGFTPDPANPETGVRAGFSASAEINRQDFGVTFNSPIPGGGVLLADKVQIQLEIQAVLRAA